MAGSKCSEWGVAILRIVVGLVFAIHGGQKLFVYGIDGVAAGFAQLGLPLPYVAAILATAAEFGGGVALLLGLYTRWAAMPIAATMLVAIFHVHLKNGFFAPGGFEYPLTLLAAAIALMSVGSGALSIDSCRARKQG